MIRDLPGLLEQIDGEGAVATALFPRGGPPPGSQPEAADGGPRGRPRVRRGAGTHRNAEDGRHSPQRVGAGRTPGIDARRVTEPGTIMIPLEPDGSALVDKPPGPLGLAQGFSTTLMQPSFLSRNVLYTSGAVVQRQPVGDDERRVDLAGLDLLQQRLEVALHVRLARLDRQPLVHRRRRTGSCRGSRRRRRGRRRVPPLRQHMIASRSTCARSVASIDRRLHLVEHRVDAAGRVGLAADRVDAAVRAAALGHLHAACRRRRPCSKSIVSALPCSRAIASRSGTRSMAITRPAPSIQALLMANCADRAAAPDGHRVAGLDLGVLRGHVAGREDVGEEQHLLVGQAVAILIGPTSA